jgi:excisionase family DNA binding protein
MRPLPKAPTLLSVGEVASITRTDPSTLRRWLRDGDLAGVKIGRVWRVQWSEVFDEDGTIRKHIGPDHD